MKKDRASRSIHGRILAAFACLLLLQGVSACAQPSALPPKETDALALLLNATSRLSNKDSSGTCFLVAPPPGWGWPNRTVVLVTAAHAFEQATGPESLVVLREQHADGSLARREVTLPIRSGEQSLWTKHPDEDVAAIKLTLPPDVSSQPIRLDQIAPVEDLTNGCVRLGSGVWIFCHPAKLEANDAGLPVLRHGTVSSLPLLPLSSHTTFLVDFTTFGGDSGAPVMLGERGGPPSSVRVIGLVLGMHRQTDKVSLPFEERTVHYPLGLSIIAHAGIIRETIGRMPH